MAIGAVGTRLAAEAHLKWAIVNLTEPTMIAGKIVAGPVVFVHDDAKMARGEPCTSVHQFSPVKGVGEELVAFHCKPRWSNAPAKFTTSTNRDPIGPRTLTEYQFAGDTEAHGVPLRDKQTAAPHDMKGMKDMKGMQCADCAKDMKCGDGCKDCKDCSDCKDCQNCKSCKH
jgi:hypothetical protein